MRRRGIAAPGNGRFMAFRQSLLVPGIIATILAAGSGAAAFLAPGLCQEDGWPVWLKAAFVLRILDVLPLDNRFRWLYTSFIELSLTTNQSIQLGAP